jgi:undecaprenyl-diphosphatase
MTKRLLISLEVILSICFIMMLILVLNGNISNFDNNIYSLISNLISNSMTSFMKIITFLGSAYTLITITVLLILFSKDKIYFSINLIGIFLLNQLLKHIIQRPRPVDINIINENGYSFPSGHSMISMAVYGFLIYYIYKNMKNKRLKWLLILLLSILILLIGFSRIYLGVHFASDVLGGFILSLIWLIIFILIIDNKTNS